eukprot:Sdes_comp8810_c0_seq1m197
MGARFNVALVGTQVVWRAILWWKCKSPSVKHPTFRNLNTASNHGAGSLARRKERKAGSKNQNSIRPVMTWGFQGNFSVRVRVLSDKIHFTDFCIHPSSRNFLKTAGENRIGSELEIFPANFDEDFTNTTSPQKLSLQDIIQPFPFLADQNNSIAGYLEPWEPFIT